MIRTFAFACCLAAVCSGQAARTSGPTVRKADSGKTIEMAAGRPLVVELEGKPTTGYDWIVEPGSLGKPVEKWIGSGEVEGGSAVKRIEWPSVPAGDHELRVTYRRRGDADPPVEVFTLKIRAR